MLLAREVDHRAKNALAVAQALVSLTRADTVAAYAEAVTGRIASLARAHSLLSRSRWTGASLKQVLCDELTTYAKDRQIRVVGQEITLNAEAVQPLSLVFHELATNAVKHGALATDSGCIDVTWQPFGGTLRLTWAESGGPVVREPERTGFGSKLLEKTVRRQLGAKLGIDWLPEGLRVELSIPGHLFFVSTTGIRASSEAEEDVALTLDGSSRTVLVVEDEELVAMELVTELERLGWHVLGPAATVAEAEALLKSASSVDAAVLDVNLRGRPVYPLAELLEKRKIPFLFCTGYEVIDPAGRFQDVPVIRKPAHGIATATALQRLLLR